MGAGAHVELSAYRATCAGARIAADGYHFAVLTHPRGRFFYKDESPATCLEEFSAWSFSRFGTPAGTEIAAFGPAAFMTRSLASTIGRVLPLVKDLATCSLVVEGGRLSLLEKKVAWLVADRDAEKAEGLLATRSWVLLIPEQKTPSVTALVDKTLVRRALGEDLRGAIERTAALAASCGVSMQTGDIARALVKMEAHSPEIRLALDEDEGYYSREYKGSDPYVPSAFLDPSGFYVVASHHKQLAHPRLLHSGSVRSSYAFKVAAEPEVFVSHAVSADPRGVMQGLRLQGRVANTPPVVAVAPSYVKGACSVTRYFEEMPFSTLAMVEKELADKGAYLSPEEVLQIASAVLASLGDLHAQGFAHRGLSPESIRLDKIAGGYLARVGLFQRACSISDRLALSNPGPLSFLSDPLLCDLVIKEKCVMSEVFAKLDPRLGDIWALGALLFLLVVQESLVAKEEEEPAAAGGAGSDARAATEDALIFDVDAFVSQCSRSGWVTTRLIQLGKIDKIDPRLVKLLQVLLEPQHDKRMTAKNAKELVEVLMTAGYERALTTRRPSLAGKGAS